MNELNTEYKIWLRNCPKCNKQILYNGLQSEKNCKIATRKKSNCRSCQAKLVSYLQPKGKNSKNYRGYEDLPSRMFTNIKRCAIKRNIEFKITIQDCWYQWLKQNGKCAYTGEKLTFMNQRKRIHTASLDRIDSSKGYEIDNIQWVHKDVNFMKQSYNQEYFINLCKQITEYNTFKELTTPIDLFIRKGVLN